LKTHLGVAQGVGYGIMSANKHHKNACKIIVGGTKRGITKNRIVENTL